MLRNPFDRLQPQIVSVFDAGQLREVLVAVPVSNTAALPCRVIVSAGDDWARRAGVAGIVTVEAVRQRLAAHAAAESTE